MSLARVLARRLLPTASVATARFMAGQNTDRHLLTPVLNHTLIHPSRLVNTTRSFSAPNEHKPHKDSTTNAVSPISPLHNTQLFTTDYLNKKNPLVDATLDNEPQLFLNRLNNIIKERQISKHTKVTSDELSTILRQCLTVCAIKGYKEIAQIILDSKMAKANDGYYYTHLAVAAANGNFEMVKLLTQYGANPDFQYKSNIQQISPIIAAMQKGYEDIALYLLPLSLEINSHRKLDSNAPNLLFVAVKCNMPKIVDYLLNNKNIDLSQKNKNNQTADQFAKEMGNLEMAKKISEASKIRTQLESSSSRARPSMHYV